MPAGITSDGKTFFTAIAYLEIKGENDISIFYFQNRWQYVYTDTKWMYIQSDDIDGLVPNGLNYVNCLHYKVEGTDGEDYCWVPSIYTSIEELRPIEEQDWRAWQENVISDQPKDHIKTYKNLTGIDLEKRRIPGHNGYEFYKKALTERYKNNGKQYGETIPK